jgi:hypothetical protein
MNWTPLVERRPGCDSRGLLNERFRYLMQSVGWILWARLL